MNKNKKRYRFRMVCPAYPTFNIYSSIAKQTTALGPICIATAVKELGGWDAEVIDENNLRNYGPKDEVCGANHELLNRQRHADIVGLYGGLTSTIPRLYEIAKIYKKMGITVIAGGQHFVKETIPEAFENGIDYIITGEGEFAIKELLSALKNDDDITFIKGIVFKKDNEIIYTQSREPITDFDVLPLPDFSLVRYAKIKIFPVERIRGCGMECEFCTVRGKPRPATPERTIQNISYLVETFRAKKFFIVDDLFGQHRTDTIKFCNDLADYQKGLNIKLDITAQIRLDKAKDTELLLAMRNAGIYTVAIGFETPIQEELEMMHKKVKPEEMIKLANIYHDHGFLVHGMFIFGYPVDKSSVHIPVSERVKRYKEFIKKAKIDTLQVLLPVPLPGTELRDRLLKQNRIYLNSDIGWEYYDGNFPLFIPDKPYKAEELHIASREIMGGFYKFNYLFSVGLHTCSFPSIIFFFNNFKIAFERWYRLWRNAIIRFGGWIIIKKWISNFKKDDFYKKQKLVHDKLKEMNKNQ
jgi:radical SAM superfamily enzyme YgiQ (UPF0313 family)